MRATAEQDKAPQEELEGNAGLKPDIVVRLREAATHALTPALAAYRADVIEAAGVIEKLRKRLYLADQALRGNPILTMHECQALDDTTNFIEGKGLAYTRAILQSLRIRLGGVD